MLILLGLVLLVFLPDPWNVVAFVVCIPLFAGEIYLWNRTVRHKRPQVGAETLIGAAGVAITECAPDGQVMARAAAMTDTILFADIDTAENGRSHARQLFLRHRRPELYAEWVGR